MSDEDGFLRRWSRRKLTKAEPEPLPEARPVEPPLPSREPDLVSDESGAAGDMARLSDEEVAALPRVEEITAETDLAPFLREGVPALLRKAALRRMWSADPAIRDFVGEARDYSWDWNVPGGVPGSGALLPSDDVPAMLARMAGAASEGESDPSPVRSDDAVAPEAPSGPESAHPANPPGPEPGADATLLSEAARPSGPSHSQG